ncbi:MAG: TatD family hydrolase [bacterium]
MHEKHEYTILHSNTDEPETLFTGEAPNPRFSNKLMFIDSHAHIVREEYGTELEQVFVRSREAGVEAIIIPGTNLQSSREAVQLSTVYDDVYACVGVHPHEASKSDEMVLKEIEALSHEKKVVAIGEIGLDYHYDFSPRDIQRSVFRKQLEIGAVRNLPVVIHTRESVQETIDLVSEVAHLHPGWGTSSLQESSNRKKRGVFHCFPGTVEECRRVFDLGFYVSYPGIVTFKNAKVVETIRAIGIEQLLLETDSPYMTPVPHRGKKNEPGYIRFIAQKLADVLHLPIEKIAEITTTNTKTLFGIH